MRLCWNEKLFFTKLVDLPTCYRIVMFHCYFKEYLTS